MEEVVPWFDRNGGWPAIPNQALSPPNGQGVAIAKGKERFEVEMASHIDKDDASAVVGGGGGVGAR